MKVLRIIGIVAAIHAFAFLLIMANPGCSTKPKSKPASEGSDSAASGNPSPVQSAPEASPISPAPIPFDPDAVAVSVPRYSPTRPGTPASSALQAEQAADVIPATTVTVSRGDSLWTIAKKHHIPVADLAAANNLSTGATLRVGQKLVVPSKALGTTEAAKPATKQTEPKPAAAVAPKAAVSGDSVRHVVKPGESLALIAKKYGVKQGVIAEANAITNPSMVRAGQELVIPGWQAPKSAKPAAEPKPAAAEPTKAPEMPKIGLPSADQDLDTGLKPSAGAPVPVIKIDDSAAPAPAPAP